MYLVLYEQVWGRSDFQQLQQNIQNKYVFQMFSFDFDQHFISFFKSKFKITLGLLNNGSEETGFFDISIDGFERSEQQLETNCIHKNENNCYPIKIFLFH